MTERLLSTLFALFLISKISYSWDTTAAKFYPLAVGNSWSYRHLDYGQPLGCSGPMYSYNYIITIVSDTVVAGHRYFRFSNGLLERIDSSTMNVYRRSGSNDCLLDSLFARMNNSYYSCRYEFGDVQVCDTSQFYFVGQNRRTKAMCVVGGNYRLMFGIGLYRMYYCELSTGSADTLNGCIINGIQYGQMLGVQTIGDEVPSGFKLHQNYPNPFNQLTIINFQLSIKAKANIVLFDVLGREIAVLVNQTLEAGTYQFSLNAEGLPSGLYFYNMSVDGKLIDTRKLILVK